MISPSASKPSHNAPDTALLCLADILRNLIAWSSQNDWDFERALQIARAQVEADGKQ